MEALVASKRFPMKFTTFQPKNLIHLDPTFFIRGMLVPETCRSHIYKNEKTSESGHFTPLLAALSELQNLTNTNIEKKCTCRRFWAFILRIGEYFEELHIIIISKVRLDDNQVTFFLLLWKYISITPYVILVANKLIWSWIFFVKSIFTVSQQQFRTR